MADFAAVLKKTIDGLKENTPEMRGRVYDKARATIEAKLAAVTPPPPATLADRQRQHLEDAIAIVEAEYAPPQPLESEATEEEDGLDRILADLDPGTIRPVSAPVPPLVNTADSAPGDKESDGWHSFEEEQRAEEISRPEAEPAPPAYRAQERRKRRAGPIAAVIVLLLIAGVAAAAWFNRDSLDTLPGYDKVVALFDGWKTQTTPAETASGQSADEEEAQELAETAGAESGEPADDSQTQSGATPRKFTQRLTESGDEVDEGPAGGEPTIGEGTSVAEASEAAPGQASVEDSAAGASDASAGTDQQVAVAQKAIFYEERTNAAQGSAESGTVVWSLVQESPGDDLPPEPAIRGEATIPGKDLQLRITIKRNADKSLPASHIVEMIFLTPDDFPGGGINNVLRISMKHSEQDTGNPLLGIPAKIADGFFLFALNDSKAEEQTNLLLMKRQEWIDIPLVYKSGRRALITMEKGIPGDKVFDEALEAWSKQTSG